MGKGGLTTSRSSLDDKSNSSPRRAIFQMLQHQIGTNEITGLSPLLADNPAETSFNGGGVLVKVLTVKAHPCFKPETVSSSKTCQLDWSLRK